jgi:glycerol-3-phosphate dehydrogenase (NAD(P)+)
MAKRIAVLGAGSWGTALAQIQAQTGHTVTLWDRKRDFVQEVTRTRENRKYHPGIQLSPNIRPETEIRTAVQNADFVILAIPSHAVRETLLKAYPSFSKNCVAINAAKGLDLETQETMLTVVTKAMGEAFARDRYAVLSGPSFAYEVVRGLPTAVTVAACNPKTAEQIQNACHTEPFHIYTTDDVIGVEIAGALKNVIAIVTGVVDGFKLGNNARAGLITRGLVEISRIGKALGAHPLTFSGLAGLGDLILTCTGDLSRNRRVGIKMAEGKSLRTIMKEVGQVAEGIRTTKSAYLLAKKLKVDVPILTEAYLAMYEGKSPETAIRDLLARDPQWERD